MIQRQFSFSLFVFEGPELYETCFLLWVLPYFVSADFGKQQQKQTLKKKKEPQKTWFFKAFESDEKQYCYVSMHNFYKKNQKKQLTAILQS